MAFLLHTFFPSIISANSQNFDTITKSLYQKMMTKAQMMTNTNIFTKIKMM